MDGEPDENSRYENFIGLAIHHFYHSIDALFVATDTPSRSTFYRMERHIAPLSQELSGRI